MSFADDYRSYAKEKGAEQLYGALCQVPHKGAQSFYQACVFLKFIQFTLRCNRNNHITLGGFDKYMFPYFESDLNRGVSEDELFETLEDFRPVVEENNLILFQAHPFRCNMTVIDQSLVDGVEVYNGHGDHNSSNDIAYRWAEKYSLRKLSGSDFHGNLTLEPGGVYFDEYLTDSYQVAEALRNGKYELKIFEK